MVKYDSEGNELPKPIFIHRTSDTLQALTVNVFLLNVEIALHKKETVIYNKEEKRAKIIYHTGEEIFVEHA